MTEEQKDPEWWEQPNQPEEPKQTVEGLLVKMERMKLAYQGIPRGLLFKQFFALTYVVINIVFMYVSLKLPSAPYVAIYMVPLIIVLLDYFLVVGQLKKIAKGEKSG